MNDETRTKQAKTVKDHFVNNMVARLTSGFIPGLAANLQYLDEAETEQATIDALSSLKEQITDLQREIGRKAVEEGRFVRFPS